MDNKYKEEIQHKTETIGEILKKNGYFGFYNVDYILGCDGQLYVIEINARWGFSTILTACLYGKQFWKVVQGAYTEEIEQRYLSMEGTDKWRYTRCQGRDLSIFK